MRALRCERHCDLCISADGVPAAAKHDAEKAAAAVQEDEFGAKDYRSQMQLKPDHASRPLWVVGGGAGRCGFGWWCKPFWDWVMVQAALQSYGYCRPV